MVGGERFILRGLCHQKWDSPYQYPIEKKQWRQWGRYQQLYSRLIYKVSVQQRGVVINICLDGGSNQDICGGGKLMIRCYIKILGAIYSYHSMILNYYFGSFDFTIFQNVIQKIKIRLVFNTQNNQSEQKNCRCFTKQQVKVWYINKYLSC